ncbi:hypothetical protein AcW1_008806 [Taiwanofungus camphoratus]|nr:hypothetical protein AcW1_008806 [Antrodia cinnamomea]
MLSAWPVSLNEDASLHPTRTKTPGRTLKGRNALQENAVYHGPMTVNAKSKIAQTPLRPLTAHAHKVGKGSVKPKVTLTRPLLDKTPFPNRVANSVPFKTPVPQTAKLAKLSLLDAGPIVTPGALLRPSSTRKSLRIPRSSSGGKAYKFETPVTQGNHWDVSDGDVSVGEVDTEEKKAVEEEDYDEVEYGPPTAIDPSYEPPFEMPDYKVLGRTLFEMAHSDHFDDTADHYYAADIETQIDIHELLKASGFASSPSKWEKLDLPELEDDSPFRRRPATTAVQEKTMAKPAPRAGASRPTSIARPATRPGPPVRPQPTAASTRAPSRATTSTATGIATRPATSASTMNHAGRMIHKPGATVSATAATARSATSSGVRTATVIRKPPSASSSKLKAPLSSTTSAAATVPRRVPVPSSSSTVPAAPRCAPAPLRVGSTTRTQLATKATAVPGHGGSSSVMGARSKLSSATALPKAKAVRDDLLLVFDDVADVDEDFKFDV